MYVKIDTQKKNMKRRKPTEKEKKKKFCDRKKNETKRTVGLAIKSPFIKAV